jgi:hypothetical protein
MGGQEITGARRVPERISARTAGFRAFVVEAALPGDRADRTGMIRWITPSRDHFSSCISFNPSTQYTYSSSAAMQVGNGMARWVRRPVAPSTIQSSIRRAGRIGAERRGRRPRDQDPGQGPGVAGDRALEHHPRVSGLVGTIRTIERRWSLAPLHWAPFTSAEDEFSAEFPSTPTLKSATNTLGPKPFTQRMQMVQTAGAHYSVTTSSFGAPAVAAARLFDAYEGDITSPIHGKVIERHDIALGDVPGRELLIESSDPRLFVKVHVFLTERHLYKIVVGRSERSVGADDAERFLSSFALRPAGTTL